MKRSLKRTLPTSEEFDEFSADLKKKPPQEASTVVPDPQVNQLCKQFKCSFRDLMGLDEQDVCFQVQDKEFLANKKTLLMKCKYFKQLFEEGLSQPNSNKIIISDIDPILFKKLLDFACTDEIKLNEAVVFDLLRVADKWSYFALKSECESFLSREITLDNFEKVVMIAKQVQTCSLDNLLVDFAIQNFQVLKDRNCLNDLSENMFVEIIERLMRQKNIYH